MPLGLSLARVCADDFGSALRMFQTLKTHVSIFQLDASMAGLQLKVCRCVIVITCTALDGDAHIATITWLRTDAREPAQFVSASSGKYLGWYLGAASLEKS